MYLCKDKFVEIMQLYEDNFVEIMQLYIICDELSSELSDKNTKNRLSLIKMRKNKIGWSKKYVYDKNREIYYDFRSSVN